MGCHTWFYRRCNKEELALIKQGLLNNVITEYNVWENAVNNRFDLIPKDYIELYSILTNISNMTPEEYSEHAYNILYAEYFDIISSVDDICKNNPDYENIDYNSFPETEKEKLDLAALYYGFKNFLDIQKYILDYHGASFSRFCVLYRNMFRKKLSCFDIQNIEEFTENDDIENIELSCFNITSGGLIKKHKGNFYTDKDMYHDIFRIHNYDSPVFDNRYELIDWVNAWKKENNEDPLSEEQIKQIHEIFDKYNNDVVVDFG